MKVQVDKEELLHSLYIAVGIVEKKTTLPLLAHVLLEANEGAVRVTATDLEIGVRRAFPAEVVACGAVTVDAHKIYEIVREIEGDLVELVGEGSGLNVLGGKSRFRLLGGDPKDFPSLPVGPPAGKDPTAVLKLSSSEMLDIIDKTIFAAAEDNSRLQLAGVFVETPSRGSLRVVATDGHRMAMIDRDVEGEGLRQGVILPRKGLAEARRLVDGEKGPLGLSVTGGIAIVEVGAVELSMRLVEGEFPDYQQVVRKDGKRVFLAERDPLLGALRRVSILASDVARGVRLQVAPGKLTVFAQSPEHGEAQEEIDVHYEGEDFSIAFNSRYLLQALSVMGSAGRVEVAVSDEVSPCLVRTEEDPGYLHVLMPLRS